MIDNRVMLHGAMNLSAEQSAQMKQPQSMQTHLANHQIKHQQLRSEGRIANIEEQEDSTALRNDREGRGGAYQQSGERREEEPQEDLPGITIGKNRRVTMHGPNNPLRFDASI